MRSVNPHFNCAL